MTSVGDPVGEGLVASLGRPGGDATGFTGSGPELNTKRLEMLEDAVPRLTRVGLLRTPTSVQWKEIRPAALALKIEIGGDRHSTRPQRFRAPLKPPEQKQVGAIMTPSGRRFRAERKRIVELAGKYRLPAIYAGKEVVEAGGLMSYGADID